VRRTSKTSCLRSWFQCPSSPASRARRRPSQPCPRTRLPATGTTAKSSPSSKPTRSGHGSGKSRAGSTRFPSRATTSPMRSDAIRSCVSVAPMIRSEPFSMCASTAAIDWCTAPSARCREASSSAPTTAGDSTPRARSRGSTTKTTSRKVHPVANRTWSRFRATRGPASSGSTWTPNARICALGCRRSPITSTRIAWKT